MQRRDGDMEASSLCYQMLMKRIGGYKALSEALKEANQSGAYRTLIEVSPELYNKPLTYLGISTKIETFQDVDIEVHGKILKLRDFFPERDFRRIQQLFQNCLTEIEIFKTFLTKQRTFVLARNTVPPKPPFYVSRFISNRVNIDASVFKEKCSDVFVFKNTIARYKLTQIAKPQFTDTSSSQLTHMTCRFIYLEENEDWIEFRKSAKTPIHLINYEPDGNRFILEDTSAPSDILLKFVSKEDRVYFTEDEFVKHQLSEDLVVSNVCICDSPGMGKTLLLANIARCMIEHCTKSIFVFLPLTQFSIDFSPQNISTWNGDTAILNVLKYISTSEQNQKLLLKLIQAKLLQMGIFFDGLDEVSSDKLDLVKQTFLCITTEFSNVRIFITSRPHMRDALEKSLGVLAYDILPFDQQNQVDFLTHFWAEIAPNIDLIVLEEYATSCLEAVHKSLTKNDKKITGVPLLCHMIAKLYAEKLKNNSVKRRRLCNDPLQCKLPIMYQNFITNKIRTVAKKEEELEDFKLVHIWHALKLLFPTNGFHEDNKFKKVNDLLTSSENLRIGILQKAYKDLEFTHRTFAEYLVAEYFSATLQNIDVPIDDAVSMLKVLFKCPKTTTDFQYRVTVSFFNFALGEVMVSEELKTKTSIFVASVSNEELIGMLRACCQHNFVQICSLFREALIKCDNSCFLECFTHKKCYNLLSICIRNSTNQMFHSCIQLLTEVGKLNLTQKSKYRKWNTLLQIAVRFGNYAAVEYFVDKIPLQDQQVVRHCVEYSYNDENLMLVKTEDILKFLCEKDVTLVHENPNILTCNAVHLRLIKLLVEFGANLYTCGENVAMNAANYMSPDNFHNLIEFLLNSQRAEFLFLSHERWYDPMPKIINRAALLPMTLDRIFNIPGVLIDMTNENGNNLAFRAVKRNQLNNLKYLLSHGLDYKAKGTFNRTLLHEAAKHGGQEILQFLLTLELDPNSCTELNWTPLHYAVHFKRELSIIKTLVENGACLDAKNDQNKTAVDFASDNAVVKSYLMEKRAHFWPKKALVNHLQKGI